MSKKILMHVAADGTTKIEAEGYTGGTCLDATMPFENIFKGEVRQREMVGDCAGTPDMGERVR